MFAAADPSKTPQPAQAIPPELQAAAQVARKLLGEQNSQIAKLKPQLTRIEYLDRELQRKHETCRVSMEKNQVVDLDYEEIQALTNELVSACQDLVKTPAGTEEK